MGRRRLLGALMSATVAPAVSAEAPAAVSTHDRRLLASFTAARPGSVDLSTLVPRYTPGITRLRLRADVAEGRGLDQRAFVDLESQYPEFRFESPRLDYFGAPAGSLQSGASAIRVQIESTDTAFDDRSSVTRSGIARIHVDALMAEIKHGLDSWISFDALSRAVQGEAPAGSPPRGRTDLIGATFEITPGMFSEGFDSAGGRGRVPAPVARLQFPCTLRAMSREDRPVFRSISGERDIIQVEASMLPPIDGEVVLQDLVIRDNRGWYDTGEAGVRIKDRFPGRSVRIERCEFVRCQNAVAGGGLGQHLRILDCRIIDCGFDDQAHSLYVQPQWLEFIGNVVSFSAGNRFARAHMVKTRALNSRILGNHISMNDCAVSFLIDVSNGGDCEIGGNILHHGRRSDNTGATLVAYAPEGAGADTGRIPPTFTAGRRFRLVARNNTLISDFAASTHFFAVHEHLGPQAEGGLANSFPDPLQVADNVYWSAGWNVLVTRRNRIAVTAPTSNISGQYPDNTMLRQRPSPSSRAATAVAPRNTTGHYMSRRFTGHTYLGTGSEPFDFERRGAG